MSLEGHSLPTKQFAQSVCMYSINVYHIRLVHVSCVHVHIYEHRVVSLYNAEQTITIYIYIYMHILDSVSLQL